MHVMHGDKTGMEGLGVTSDTLVAKGGGEEGFSLSYMSHTLASALHWEKT